MSKGVSQYEKCCAEIRMMRRAQTVRKAAMRKRLAARDSAYAENAAPITIEERNCVVIETRGRCCISSRCGVISQGDTRTLAEIAKPSISECESVRKARDRMRRKSKGGKSCKR